MKRTKPSVAASLAISQILRVLRASSPSWAVKGFSVVAYSEKQDAALEYIQWFAQPEIQQQWWELGGYSALKAVVEDPGFATSQPYAQTFLD